VVRYIIRMPAAKPPADGPVRNRPPFTTLSTLSDALAYSEETARVLPTTATAMADISNSLELSKQTLTRYWCVSLCNRC